MIPEEHSVERGCDHDDGDEADHGQGGSLVHFLSRREDPEISLGVESREVVRSASVPAYGFRSSSRATTARRSVRRAACYRATPGPRNPWRGSARKDP